MIFYSHERKGIFILLLFFSSFLIISRLSVQQDHGLFLLPYPEITEEHSEEEQVIELNLADTLALMKVRGIGTYYASRIVAYRERLGGYYSVDQLKELKMKYLEVDSLKHLFSADSKYIQKRNLDDLSFKELLSHPYLEYEDVKAIFDARRKYKRVTADTLKMRGVLPDYKCRKIKYYFH